MSGYGLPPYIVGTDEGFPGCLADAKLAYIWKGSHRGGGSLFLPFGVRPFKKTSDSFHVVQGLSYPLRTELVKSAWKWGTYGLHFHVPRIIWEHLLPEPLVLPQL